MVFFGSENGQLYAADLHTGTLLWSFATRGRVISTPAVCSDVVVVGRLGETVNAVNIRTGKESWRLTAMATTFWSSPAIAEGVVYIGGNNGMLYALELKTGKELWHFKAKGQIRSSPVVADGVIYISDMDGYVYALR
jgi:outer membrane protein assembly factor BamB